MVRRHRRSRCWLVAFGGILACWAASAADPSPQQVEHPFRNLAAWLREASPDMRSADPKAISRGITVLSNSQSYVKSFDGMAYELKGKIKEGESTADIDKLLEQAELYESKSSAKKARKLVKLLIEVERSLDSAEAAEIAAQSDPARAARYMKDTGLRFLPEPPPPPPPPTPEDINATTTAATSAESVVEDTASAEVTSASKVPARSRGGSSKSNATVGGKTAAERAAAKTAAERRRPSSSAPAAADRRSAVGNDGSSGGSGSRSGAKKESKKRSKREGSVSAVEEDGSSTAVLAAAVTGEPLETFVVNVAGCEVRCLLMLEEREGEEDGKGEGEEGRLVVAVGDSLTGAALLQSLFEEPAVVQLASHGLMRETAYVNRAAFQSACDILEWAGPFIKASVEPGGPFEGYRVHCAGHSFGGAVAACLAGLLDGAIDLEAPPTAGDSSDGGGSREGSNSKPGRSAGNNNRQREQKQKAAVAGGRGEAFRDRGPGKKGGGIGSRSGRRLSDPSSSEGSEESGEGGDGGGGGGAVRVGGAAPWVAACRDGVTCVTLGCPPCLSQNLRLPFVTSFVLGDDMVPRTSHESLRRLKRRLLQVMPKGKGLLSQGVAFSTSLFTDVAGVAMQGVRQATTLGEDDARLTVPGRVWFVKPRRLKNGATLSRVMQGNLKEDMLWQLHDIMLTKSMLSHHRLDKYVKILDRV